MIDRRYNKEGACNIVFTSNKSPSLWRENFNEDDALLAMGGLLPDPFAGLRREIFGTLVLHFVRYFIIIRKKGTAPVPTAK